MLNICESKEARPDWGNKGKKKERMWNILLNFLKSPEIQNTCIQADIKAYVHLP